jgi:hypothetical protein
MELCGLNMISLAILGDEEQNKRSGPGLEIQGCFFLPSNMGRVFAVEGWNGSGNFPRPYQLNLAHIWNNTFISGPQNSGLVLWGVDATKPPKDSLVENNIFYGYGASGEGITVQSHSSGYDDVVFRHNLYVNTNAPPQITGEGDKQTNAKALHNPFAEIKMVVPFDVRSPTLPNVATTLDLANYAPGEGSPALGMASDGSEANGIAPPYRVMDVGAAPGDVTPPPDPEPEPPSAWEDEMLALGEAIDALITQVNAVTGKYNDLALALNELNEETEDGLL